MRHYSAVLAITLVCGLAAFSQGNTGAISGIVLNENGGAVAGAMIKLDRKTSDGLDRNFRTEATDVEGKFQFAGLPFGDYEIEITPPMARPNRFQFSINTESRQAREFKVQTAPCSGLKNQAAEPLTDSDRAEILRQLMAFVMNGKVMGGARPNAGQSVSEFLFVPDNLNPDWLSIDQQKRVKIMRRSDLQEIADKEGDLNYFRISR
ncbi:MAG: carboxypeptidase regulatory-like domain-containing protein [Acidobacteria bacterium]|nr:carboxypeptidase regulatory-like domain-containing protein [Acidobacteriota bacterium]